MSQNQVNYLICDNFSSFELHLLESGVGLGEVGEQKCWKILQKAILGPINTLVPWEFCNTSLSYFLSLNMRKPTFYLSGSYISFLFSDILEVKPKNLLTGVHNETIATLHSIFTPITERKYKIIDWLLDQTLTISSGVFGCIETIH